MNHAISIDSLLVQKPKAKARDRRLWGIPLEGVWLPFLLATNAEGKTAISAEALGAPLRLAKNSDNSVKFSKTGRPVFTVVREIREKINDLRDNFIGELQKHTDGVISENAEGYKAEVAKAQKAGRPIIEADAKALDQAIEAMRQAELEKAMAEATGQKAEAKAEKPKAKEPAMAGVKA